MEKIRVLLVEDDPMAKQLIEMFITNSEKYHFEGTISSASMVGEQIFSDTTPTLTVGQALSVEFTKKELEVLRLVVAGERDDDIAEALGLLTRTVKMHIRNMKDKTGLRNRTELAVKVRDAGLVIVEPKSEEYRSYEPSKRFDGSFFVS